MRVVAERFTDFAYWCKYRRNRVCIYWEGKKSPRCLTNRCPAIKLPLRGEPQDAILKTGGEWGA